MSDYTIWVSYHKDEQVQHYGLKEDEHHKLFPTHKDAELPNINVMNPVYSEMVTMWYVWKNNLKSDYVGFEHYRRHLSIARMPEDNECIVYNRVSLGSETLYQQYCHWHNQADMDLMLEVLDDTYGENNIYVKHIVSNNMFIANCTFLMKWRDFTQMCCFLFGAIDEYSKRVGIVGHDEEALCKWQDREYSDFNGVNFVYQTRVVSFLAERLISAWIAADMKATVSRI